MTKIQNDPLKHQPVPAHTETMLAPLFTWRGRDVYPVFGASQPVGEPDSEPDDDEGDGEPEGPPPSGDQVSREDFDKLKNQLSAADKNRAEAEKRLKAIEDAKKDELTKATEQVAELTKQHEQDVRELAEARLQNAFLTAETGITWHDNGDALALAERKGYLADVVGEDGKVDSNRLTTKLKEMAKAHSYLVKGEQSPEEDKPPVRTGAPVGGKQRQKKGEEPDLSRYNRHFH